MAWLGTVGKRVCFLNFGLTDDKKGNPEALCGDGKRQNSRFICNSNF